MSLRTQCLLAVWLLLTAGCAHSKVASRSAATENWIVKRALPEGESACEELELASEGEGECAIEQTAHEEAGSTDEWTLPADRLLTLDSLEQIALSTNPTLVEMRARINAASGRWLQVGLKPNPQFGYTAPEIGNEGTAGQQGTFLQQATRYEDVILQNAKRNLDLSRSTFDAGETAYLAVLTAQRSYSQARLAWLDALEQTLVRDGSDGRALAERQPRELG